MPDGSESKNSSLTLCRRDGLLEITSQLEILIYDWLSTLSYCLVWSDQLISEKNIRDVLHSFAGEVPLWQSGENLPFICQSDKYSYIVFIWDMWHVTCDTWNVTRDMWHVVGVNIVSKCQLHSSYGLVVMIFWSFEVNKYINDKGIFKTAPATPGLSKICHLSHALLCLLSKLCLSKLCLCWTL